MGRKKRTIVALKPFCYYCDKEFNNEIVLHQHQKARHFNCHVCRKRFSTGPALDTHVLQVHKEKLSKIPNAKSGRDMFDISIYGMDGVPIELINLKLVEKVEAKKRRLIRENKLEDILEVDEETKDNRNRKKVRNDRRVEEVYIFNKNSGFYRNPDSINLTLNQNQMNSMFNYNQNVTGMNDIKMGNPHLMPGMMPDPMSMHMIHQIPPNMKVPMNPMNSINPMNSMNNMNPMNNINSSMMNPVNPNLINNMHNSMMNNMHNNMMNNMHNSMMNTGNPNMHSMLNTGMIGHMHNNMNMNNYNNNLNVSVSNQNFNIQNIGFNQINPNFNVGTNPNNIMSN